MGKFIDLTGEKIERLLVLEKKVLNKKIYWRCQCDCGNIKLIDGAKIRSGRTKSCGCLAIEIRKLRLITHNKSHTKIYNTWLRIKSRCYYIKNIEYDLYGGRGIVVCAEWLNSFENFYADMGEPPTQKHSIDRIDNNGNYEPSNCRWATCKEQCNNRRNNHFLTYLGKTQTIKQWSDETGIPRKTIENRIKLLKWTIEDALTKRGQSKGEFKEIM